MFGLSDAGKTTILYRLKDGVVPQTQPTLGFNVETIQFRHRSIDIWDVGGGEKIRDLWKHYEQATRAIIFVVNSADESHVTLASEALRRLSIKPELAGIPFLIFANKQDLLSAMPVTQVSEKLGLHSLTDRSWHIQPCSAVTGDGLKDGLMWLDTAPYHPPESPPSKYIGFGGGLP